MISEDIQVVGIPVFRNDVDNIVRDQELGDDKILELGNAQSVCPSVLRPKQPAVKFRGRIELLPGETVLGQPSVFFTLRILI